MNHTSHSYFVSFSCALAVAGIAVCGDRNSNDFSVAVTRVEVRNKSLEIDYRFEYKGAEKTVPLFRSRQILKIRHYSRTKTKIKEEQVMVTLDRDFMDRKSKNFEGLITLDASPDTDFV